MKIEPQCPYCHRPADKRTRSARYRRGDRVLAVLVSHWECPSGCVGPDGTAPYRFEDAQVLRENDNHARMAWLEHFGEPMPAVRRPGRKPPAKRDVKLPVMLTAAEKQTLDELRGDMNRSEFVRRRALMPVGSPKAPRFPLKESSNLDGPHREERVCT